MKFRIKHAQQVVGFFLLTAALALVVVLVFMGANQRWFARNYSFFSRFSSAEGITTGMSVRLKGFEIGNVDCTIVAQAPKLAPYKAAMCARIAEVLGVAADQVNVKAKTAEKMGPVGDGLAMEARAVALLFTPAARAAV